MADIARPADAQPGIRIVGAAKHDLARDLPQVELLVDHVEREMHREVAEAGDADVAPPHRKAVPAPELAHRCNGKGEEQVADAPQPDLVDRLGNRPRTQIPLIEVERRQRRGNGQQYPEDRFQHGRVCLTSALRGEDTLEAAKGCEP